MARLKHRASERIEGLVHSASEQHLPRRACRRWKRRRPARIAESVDSTESNEVEAISQKAHALALRIFLIKIGKDPPGVDGIAVERPHSRRQHDERAAWLQQRPRVVE